jgi:phage nucleotide-binding protein
MAISIKRTSRAAGAVKVLVYGAAGAGKTSLIRTLPKPIVLSAEGGLLSLADDEVPYITISTIAELHEAYSWLVGSAESREFDSVAIDSLSEIAEVILTTEKRTAKDPRQAYGAMQDQLAELVRAFRDVPTHHVYVTAKLDKTTDELGKITYAPGMPGNKTGQALPYFFDEVLALRVERDAEGNAVRGLQCAPDGAWLAKDRSGKLEQWESPDLGAVIRKIGGAQ